jgi:hypothetical protein
MLNDGASPFMPLGLNADGPRFMHHGQRITLEAKSFKGQCSTLNGLCQGLDVECLRFKSQPLSMDFECLRMRSQPLSMEFECLRFKSQPLSINVDRQKMRSQPLTIDFE